MMALVKAQRGPNIWHNNFEAVFEISWVGPDDGGGHTWNVSREETPEFVSNFGPLQSLPSHTYVSPWFDNELRT